MISVGAWDFDWQSYDADHDVLYLSIEPRAGYGVDTDEGHILRYDNDDVFYGVTLIGVRSILEREGTVRVSGIPRRFTSRSEQIDARQLEPALV